MKSKLSFRLNLLSIRIPAYHISLPGSAVILEEESSFEICFDVQCFDVHRERERERIFFMMAFF